MDYLTSTYLPVLLLLFVSIVLIAHHHFGKTSKPSFPGPRQFPLVGRVHDLDADALWLNFKKWADEYGPIYQTSMMGQKFVIISDEDIAREVLQKRGDIFAGRAQIRTIIRHKEGPTYFALQDRHETWRTQRKFVHAALASSHQSHYHGYIEREVRRYLANMLLNPTNFFLGTRELTGRVMSQLTWDDPEQGPQHGREAVETLTQMSVHSNITNAMPFIWHIADWVGYNPWRKFEREREEKMTTRWRHSFRTARQRFIEGTLAEDSWTYRYFQQLREGGNSKLDLSEEEEKVAVGMLGFGCMVGVVTIGTPLLYFLMAMALNQSWQTKLRDEIEGVCCGRMPGLGDYEKLPTLRACIKEALRWRSSVPMGVPHRCEETTEFRGVQIEKDTIVMACEWNLNRDEKRYPDPETYNPARYLQPSYPTYLSPLTQHPNLRSGHGMHTFGWGRRVCLGQNLADTELFLAAGAVIWGFELRPKRDALTGEEVEIDTVSTNSNVILEPKAWKMEILPREGKVGAMLDSYKETL